MKFLGFKTGSSIIGDALASFRAVVTELEKGIELSTTEREHSVKELADATAEFERTKTSINTTIADNDKSVAQALKVKTNIENLLDSDSQQ